MLPVIPIAAISVIGGLVTLITWYIGLTPEERKEADTAAWNYAMRLFGVEPDKLSKEQAEIVVAKVKSDF